MSRLRLRFGFFHLDGTGWFVRHCRLVGYCHVLNGWRWRIMSVFLLPDGLGLQPVFQVMPVRMPLLFPNVIGDQLYFLFVVHGFLLT
jgi:hypothetical protein